MILRSPVKWFGGKGKMLKAILPLIPHDHVYIEPFAGGANILLNREPSEIEVLNDLHRGIVNLFRVLQSTRKSKELAELLRNTLYSRAEFERAIAICSGSEAGGEVCRAWAMIVETRQGFGGRALVTGNWSRVKERSSTAKSFRHATAKDVIDRLRDRLRYTYVECRDALSVMRFHAADNSVIYADPPYVAATRSSGGYDHEMDDAQHVAFIDCVLSLPGAIVVSGYDSPLYRPLRKAGWKLTRFNVFTSATNTVRLPRTECVWQNPRAVELIKAARSSTAEARMR